MNKSTAMFRISLTNGLITGVIFSLISALIYLLDINMFSNIFIPLAMLLVNTLIVIFAIIISIKKVRETVIDQSLKYGGRFFTGLIVGVIAAWVAGLFSYLLFQVIDPEYMSTQMEGLADMMINMGMPEEDAYLKVDEAKASLQPMEQFKSAFLKMPAFYIAISLIVSAFIKEKKQVDIETS